MDEMLLSICWPAPAATDAPTERKLNRRRPLRAKERAGRACSTTPFSEVPAGSIRLPRELQKGFTSTAETGSPFLDVAEPMPAVSRACMVPEVRSTKLAAGMGADADERGSRSGSRSTASNCEPAHTRCGWYGSWL